MVIFAFSMSKVVDGANGTAPFHPFVVTPLLRLFCFDSDQSLVCSVLTPHFRVDSDRLKPQRRGVEEMGQNGGNFVIGNAKNA